MIIETSTKVSDLPERGFAWLVDNEGNIRAVFYDGKLLVTHSDPQGNTEDTKVA